MQGHTLNMGAYSLYCSGNTTITGGTITGSKATIYGYNNGVIEYYASSTVKLMNMIVKATGSAAAVYCGSGAYLESDSNHDALYISNSTICNTGVGAAIYAGGHQIYNVRITDSSQVYSTAGSRYSVIETVGINKGKVQYRHPYAVFSTYANIITESGTVIRNNNYERLVESYYGNVTIDTDSYVEGTLVPGLSLIHISEPTRP